MQVCIVNQINFKENHYHVIKTGRKYSLQEIRTDNAENLGKEPEIQCNQGSFPMIYDGKYYVGESDFTYYNTDKYRIFYNDTQSYENNGKEVNIDHKLLLSKCTIAHRHNNNLPMEFVHSKGEMKGFIITDLNNIPKKGNVILLVDEIKHVEARDLPNNVKGIITRGYNPGEYTHFSQYLNHHFAVVSSIYDDEKFEEIKKLEGKKVYINNTSGVLEYNENHKDVLMPQLKRVLVNEPNRGSFVYSRLLDFDVLTPTMSGNKGYRLGIMKKLSEQGVLKDITIPPGFVVPQYYLKDILNYHNEHTAKNNIDVFYDNPYLTELIEHCEKTRN